MPEHHPALPGTYKWAHNMPKGSRAAGNLKNYEKMSKNRNTMGEIYFLRVLCMPAHHLILLKSFGCPQTAPKVFRAAENSKNYEKWSENSNFGGTTHFYGVLGMPALHHTLPGSCEWAHNAPKGSRTAGNSKNYKKR